MCVSPFYETAPLHVSGQPPFLNAAVLGFFSSQREDAENTAAAGELLRTVQAIEAQYGRNRSVERRWGERSLDIDILLFGGAVIKEADLVIPHPRLKERAFALRPLLDLLPAAREPETGLAYSSVLAALPDQGVVQCACRHIDSSAIRLRGLRA
jgi:2-amino-4-hydroxy-6-hydroxymethyldihydropteridine diphosphokinase